MKKYQQTFVWFLLFPVVSVFGYYQDLYVSPQIALYGERKAEVEDVAGVLRKYGINFEEVSEIKGGDQLHIIVGFDSLSGDDLPPYYIFCQVDDIVDYPLSEEDKSILNHAVAIWDNSWKNIHEYQGLFSHYYFFSPTYDYNDPVVLPCFLPLDQLSSYKEILISSNNRDSDISSHLPIIFVHGTLQQPKNLLEIGVASGQSNDVLVKLPKKPGFKMIGIDINRQCAAVYQKYHNPSMKFFCMDDTLFLSRRRSFPFIPIKDYDLIFIDTSHLFDHTLKELEIFSPLLSSGGMFVLHDSNMSPIEGFHWWTINGKKIGRGWDNDKGVIRAIKAYFGIDFDEAQYFNKTFIANSLKWKIIHYPFCNGLTVIKRV